MENETIEHVTFCSSSIGGDDDRERLESTLADIPGVRDVEVDTGAQTVTVAYDPREVSETMIMSEMESSGYKVESTEYAASRDAPGR